jgi:hypothetical protein
MRGNWIDKCWKLHLEFGPKKDKKFMQEPMKKETSEENEYTSKTLKQKANKINKTY